MPLGTEVGLGPGDIVRLGMEAQLPLCPPPRKGAQPVFIFGPCLLWPNGWMVQDATWYEGSPRLISHCVRQGPTIPKGAQHPPLFSAHVYCGPGRPSRLLLSSCSLMAVDHSVIIIIAVHHKISNKTAGRCCAGSWRAPVPFWHRTRAPWRRNLKEMSLR